MSDKTVIKPRPGGRGAVKSAPVEPTPVSEADNDKTRMSANVRSSEQRERLQRALAAANAVDPAPLAAYITASLPIDATAQARAQLGPRIAHAVHTARAEAQQFHQICRWLVRGCQQGCRVGPGHRRSSECFWPCHMVGTEQ